MLIHTNDYTTPRHWPEFYDGKQTCVLHAGEIWNSGACIHYKRNDKEQVHCIFFKAKCRCVCEGDMLPKELFEI